MIRRIVYWLTLVVVLSGWPVSLAVNPPKFETGFIWQLDTAEEEKRLLLQKLGLDTTLVKQVFYNNKTTIRLDRYVNNLLQLTNLNYYFFANHPQVDLKDTDSRAKFPYPAVMGFLTGAYFSIKERKQTRIWIGTGILVLIVALFREMDGWNVGLFPIGAVFISQGLKVISKAKYGLPVLAAITFVALTEIVRLFQ